jgi:hypothetical protein
MNELATITKPLTSAPTPDPQLSIMTDASAAVHVLLGNTNQ